MVCHLTETCTLTQGRSACAETVYTQKWVNGGFLESLAPCLNGQWASRHGRKPVTGEASLSTASFGVVSLTTMVWSFCSFTFAVVTQMFLSFGKRGSPAWQIPTLAIENVRGGPGLVLLTEGNFPGAMLLVPEHSADRDGSRAAVHGEDLLNLLFIAGKQPFAFCTILAVMRFSSGSRTHQVWARLGPEGS